MTKVVNMILAALFLLGSGYSAKKLLFEIEKETLRTVKKGLSKSEPFAERLTGKKLPF